MEEQVTDQSRALALMNRAEDLVQADMAFSAASWSATRCLLDRWRRRREHYPGGPQGSAETLSSLVRP